MKDSTFSKLHGQHFKGMHYSLLLQLDFQFLNEIPLLHTGLKVSNIFEEILNVYKHLSHCLL